MGAGSSVTPQVVTDFTTNTRNVVVPLRNLEKNLKLFQHAVTGEILIVGEHDDWTEFNLDSDWLDVTLSQEQDMYMTGIQDATVKNRLGAFILLNRDDSNPNLIKENTLFQAEDNRADSKTCPDTPNKEVPTKLHCNPRQEPLVKFKPAAACAHFAPCGYFIAQREATPHPSEENATELIFPYSILRVSLSVDGEEYDKSSCKDSEKDSVSDRREENDKLSCKESEKENGKDCAKRPSPKTSPHEIDQKDRRKRKDSTQWILHCFDADHHLDVMLEKTGREITQTNNIGNGEYAAITPVGTFGTMPSEYQQEPQQNQKSKAGFRTKMDTAPLKKNTLPTPYCIFCGACLSADALVEDLNATSRTHKHCSCKYSDRVLACFDKLNQLLQEIYDNLAPHEDLMREVAPLLLHVIQLNYEYDVEVKSKTKRYHQKCLKATEYQEDLLNIVNNNALLDQKIKLISESLYAARIAFNKKIVIFQKYSCNSLGLENFHFHREVGRGGSGSVFLATQCARNAPKTRRSQWDDYQTNNPADFCAIKCVAEKDNYEKIVQERHAMTFASLYPDYFIQLKYSFFTKGTFFLVMEFAHGGNCAMLLNALTRIPEEASRHIIAQVCTAVSVLHQHGVVHRDIKPDNILITRNGHVKLGDFGNCCEYVRPGNEVPIIGYSAAESNLPHNQRQRSWKRANFTSPSQLASQESPKFGSSVSKSSKTSNDTNYQWRLNQESRSESHDISRGQSGSLTSTQSICFTDPHKARLLRTAVGNYQYSPPEMVICCGYDHTVDWWATGVLLFHFMHGFLPFDTGDQVTTMDKIYSHIENDAIDWDGLNDGHNKVALKYNQENKTTVSTSCRAFISALLSGDKEKRLGFLAPESVLEHPFFSPVDFDVLYKGYGPYYPCSSPVPETSEEEDAVRDSFIQLKQRAGMDQSGDSEGDVFIAPVLDHLETVYSETHRPSVDQPVVRCLPHFLKHGLRDSFEDYMIDGDREKYQAFNYNPNLQRDGRNNRF